MTMVNPPLVADVWQTAPRRPAEIEEELASIPEQLKNLTEQYKRREKDLKESLKEAKQYEAKMVKEAEEKALASKVKVSMNDRNYLANLHNYYLVKGNWGGSKEEREIFEAYLNERIKTHAEFIGNPRGN